MTWNDFLDLRDRHPALFLFVEFIVTTAAIVLVLMFIHF